MKNFVRYAEHMRKLMNNLKFIYILDAIDYNPKIYPGKKQ